MTDRPSIPGLVCTFYSFKGGVGRSMTLANVAALLARWGQRVLVVDWDLEAPGIEGFFRKWLRRSPRETPGIVDLVSANAAGSPLDWHSCLVRADLPGAQPIDILTAGADDGKYARRLRAINWERAFGEQRLGDYLESLRQQWISEYDFVLVDSRTGVTDIGGICTIHLPDAVVAMFTTTEQSLQKMRGVLESARSGHAELAVDRGRLLIAPVPGRDESGTEYKLAQEWRGIYARELSDFFDDWIPKEESADSVLNYLKIPYFAFWSFGERLPVVEEPDPENPKTLAFAYQPLAKLLLSRFNWKEVRAGAQASEEAAKQSAEAERLKLEALKVAEAARAREATRASEERERAGRELAERVEKFTSEVLAPESRRWYLRARSLRSIGTGSLLVLAALLVAAVGPYVPAYMSWMRWVGLVPRATEAAGRFAIAVFVVGVLAWATYRPDRRSRYFERISSLLERERIDHGARRGPYGEIAGEQAYSTLLQRVDRLMSFAQFRERSWLWMRPTAGDRFVLEGGEDSVDAAARPDSAPSRESVVEARTDSVAVSEANEEHDDYSFDVYVSYARGPVMNAWVMEQLAPLLSFWLEQALGRPPKIFLDAAVVGSGDRWPLVIARSLVGSRCLLPIWSPPYFSSRQSVQEFVTFLSRPRKPIVPVVFSRPEALPSEARSFQFIDLSEFSVLGEGFKETRRYVEFQDRLKELAERLARVIHSAPPFDPNAPVAPLERSADRTHWLSMN